jgi:hypothetical protein
MRVDNAFPTFLKMSSGSAPRNSSFSEERLLILERLRQIIAMLFDLVFVLVRASLQYDDDFGVL